jgi:type II secretory pathway pseudopilin PulG
MKRPNVRAFESGTSFRLPWAPTAGWSTFPGAFTLVEVLVATVLSLIIMAAVVTVFASISTSISQSRSTLEMSDRLRTTAAQLKRDLEGVTVTMLPPRRPETNEGYFEYIEGPVGPVFMPEDLWKWSGSTPALTTANPQTQPYAFDIDRTTGTTGVADTTIGDNDDILMFTTRAKDRPFVGRCGAPTTAMPTPPTTESWVAEVAWFVRGRTLYHRVLLVAPNAFTTAPLSTPATGTTPASGYYANYDVSAHAYSSTLVVPNSLGDLTKREYRFAHPYTGFPYDARVWGQLGLPTLRETAAAAFTVLPGSTVTLPTMPPFMARDFSTNPYPWTNYVDTASGTQSHYYDTTVTRITDDVAMTNVVGFDVKAWDPGAPVLQYNNQILMPGDSYYTKLMTGVVSWTGVSVAYYGAYVDLGWDPNSVYYAKRTAGTPLPYFGHVGKGYIVGGNYSAPTYLGVNTGSSQRDPSGLMADSNSPVDNKSARVYDTYSLHYEYDGVQQPTHATGVTVADIGTNGGDDDGYNGADDPGEAETCPPYPVPLRGIQIKIRAMDPDSGQVREVTVVQEFLPQ